MELQKRKRFEEDEEGIVDGKKVQIKIEDDQHQGGGGGTASAPLKKGGCDNRLAEEVDGGGGDADGEVEEFFAILRRIHVAVKYFEKGRGRNREGDGKIKTKNSKSTAAISWSPNFEREDFEGGCCGKGVNKENKEEGIVGDSLGLDLNVEPDPVSE